MEIQKILTRYDSYLNKGKLKDAEALLLLSLQDAEEEGLYGARLTLLNELEGLYRTTGRARQAMEISEKALALISVLGLTGQEPHAVTLLNGATACRAAGENEKALQMYRRAEQILRDLGQEEGYSMTALYNNISQAYLDLQQPQQALHYQQQALTQIRKFPDTKAEEATTQISMVQSLLMFGDVIHNSKKWQVCLFAEITSSRLGKMLDAKQQTGRNSYPYLANFNVQWFRFNLENLNKMDFDEKDRAEFELREGDLLVCEGGEIGRCAVWHNELQPCFFQKALHRVRCNHQIILPDYLAWWFRYNCDYGGFSALAGAKATIAHLPGAKLKQLQVAVPPMELQEQFAVFVAQTDKSKVAVQKALDEAQLLFDSLMQEYFG